MKNLKNFYLKDVANDLGELYSKDFDTTYANAGYGVDIFETSAWQNGDFQNNHCTYNDDLDDYMIDSMESLAWLLDLAIAENIIGNAKTDDGKQFNPDTADYDGIIMIALNLKADE